jgi:hypothetical protein
MKPVFSCLIVAALLALSPGATAQTETFDLVTFATPAGQRSGGNDNVGFTETAGNAFLQLAVYRSVAGSGDAARDFAAEWDELVAKRYRVMGEINRETADYPGGWTLVMGTAPVFTESTKQFVSMLAVFTGHGVKVSVLVNLNDQRFQPKVDAFLGSIRLREPPPQAAPAPAIAAAAPAGTGSPPPLAGREWYKSVANYSNWGYNPSSQEIAKISNQGYMRWSYVFQPDGTYAFTSEFWSMNKHQEYWFHEETGAYRVAGDTLTVTPRTARRILRNKAGQQQGEAVPAGLEPVTYRCQFHFFEGLGEWNLVLTPTTGQPTRRDGSFASNALFPTSYLFGPPPPR